MLMINYISNDIFVAISAWALSSTLPNPFSQMTLLVVFKLRLDKRLPLGKVTGEEHLSSAAQ